MSSNKIIEALDYCIANHLRNAKDQKRRVRMRLGRLTCFEVGDSRGEFQKDGTPCIRWHFYTQAKLKHRYIADRLNALLYVRNRALKNQ